MNPTGTDLLLPGQMTPAAVLDALSTRLSLRDGAGAQRDLRFYDTFDGLLHAAGLAFVHESGRLALVSIDLGAEQAGMPAAVSCLASFLAVTAPLRSCRVPTLPAGMLTAA